MMTPKILFSDDDLPLDRLRETYLHWTKTQLEKLHYHIGIIEQQQESQYNNHDAEIYKLAEYMKDVGGSFGYFLMTDIAASLCDYIQQIENDPHIKICIIIAHVQMMDMVIHEKIDGSGGEDGDKILRRLHRLSLNKQQTDFLL